METLGQHRTFGAQEIWMVQGSKMKTRIPAKKKLRFD